MGGLILKNIFLKLLVLIIAANAWCLAGAEAQENTQPISLTRPNLNLAYRNWLNLTARARAQSGSGQHDTLLSYSQKCDAATGITIPTFSCSAGADVPGQGTIPATEINATHCDYPNVLNGLCDPGSKFQVLNRSADGNAVAVAHCRKDGQPEAGENYNDIAIIQYNKQNGAICFFQALGHDQTHPNKKFPLPGDNIPSPSAGDTALWADNKSHWISPAATEAIGCASCHDSGGFIRSEYIAQMKAPNFDAMHTLPSIAEGFNNLDLPLKYVGLDYKRDRSWAVELDPPDPAGSCTSCHRLAVANHLALHHSLYGGTAMRFAAIATARKQDSKNPHSATSPIWMKKGQVVYDPVVAKLARRYRTCAVTFYKSRFTKIKAGCKITPLAEPW
jgi:hypothetical protein